MITKQKPSNILRMLHSIIRYLVEKDTTDNKVSGTKPLQKLHFYMQTGALLDFLVRKRPDFIFI